MKKFFFSSKALIKVTPKPLAVIPKEIKATALTIKNKKYSQEIDPQKINLALEEAEANRKFSIY